MVRVCNDSLVLAEFQKGRSEPKKWILTGVADSTQLGTRVRVQSKMQKIQKHRSQSAIEGLGKGKQKSEGNGKSKINSPTPEGILSK
jgi:hypothetical protein